MGKRKWIQPGKEYIELVTARKNYLCHECGKPIFKGDQYILDSINYIKPKREGGAYLKWYQNKICLKSWKGELPK